jgi:hypothetical protein
VVTRRAPRSLVSSARTSAVISYFGTLELVFHPVAGVAGTISMTLTASSITG